MQISKNKSATLVALFLVFAMAVSLVALPATNAQTTRTSYPFIGAVPNPVGVGQEVLLHVGITLALQTANQGWEGLTVTVTRPDGTTETLRDIRTDSTGGTGVVYVPTMVGNYTLQTHFPEQVTTNDKRGRGTPVGTVMLASSSEKLTLVVQEEPVLYYPAHPLPTEYWTRPIDAQLREWNMIAGSWLSSNRRYPEFKTGNDMAPESAHILWTKPLTMAGLAGGIGAAPNAFSMGDAYEGKWDSRLIICGMLIYLHRGSFSDEYTAVDLHTGEELWTNVFLDNRSISMGQLLLWNSYNHHGVYPYLWVTVGSTWYAFDPWDTLLRLTVTNVPSGTNLVDDYDGRIYRWSVSTAQRRMLLWNLSALVSMEGSWSPGRSPGGEYNASATTSSGALTTAAQRAYALNITIPQGLPGSARAVKLGDKVVGCSTSQEEVYTWAFSLKPGQEGLLLYNKTWKAPAEWVKGNLTVEFNAISIDDGFMVVRTTENIVNYGFSTETGDYLWTSEPQNYLNYYGLGSERYPVIAYGNYYSTGVSGIVYCNDGETGELLWTYEANDPYSEILWANNWWQYLVFVTDGKVYSGHLEHSPVDPMPRGGPFVCLNATTGEVIWRADGLFRQTLWGGLGIIGDSIIATMDTYDNRIYAIGKGPSATTVTAPDIGVQHGSSVLLKGMVTDVSPGTDDIALKKRFPNGVPAVSDESMSDWMLYVYKQFARPADAVGVEVVLEVVDPNNNCYEVGRATSDASGFFSCVFTPEVPGKYSVIATFEGSKSYYGSFAETALFVEEAPQPTPVPTPTPASVADMYFLPVSISMIVAIIVVGVLLALLLIFRKR